MSPPKMKSIVMMAAVAALVGCSGGPTDDPHSHSVGLVDSPPLPTLIEQDWQGAAEGCEGRLDGSESFGITQVDALVVARRDDDAVCIDTLDAVSLELEALGAEYAADELYSGFYAAIHLSQVNDWATPASAELPGDGGEAEGDPNPQPNDPMLTPTMGDPNPQPNAPGDDLGPSLEDPTPNVGADPNVDPAPTASDDVPETPNVVIEDTALPGI